MVLSQPSFFLFLKLPGSYIETVIPVGIPAALQAWKQHLQENPRASGLIFAGCYPPLIDDIEEMLEICEGVMLIAESARWMFPHSYTNDSSRVAKIPASIHYPEMDVYQGSSAWGYSIRDVAVLSDMILHTWREHGTPSQEKYLARLPMIDAQDPVQISEIVPAWGLDVPVEHLALSSACLRGLKGLRLEKISDLWRLSPDQMMRSYGLGPMKRRELAQALTAFLARGPDDYSLIDANGHVRTLLECVLEEIDSLPEPKQSILRARLALDGTQIANKELASKYELTIASVHQIERNALLQMPRAQRVGQLLRHRLTALLQHRSDPLYLDGLEGEDSWFQGLSSMQPAFEVILYYFAEKQFYLWEYEHRFVIARLSWQDFSELKKRIARFGTEAAEISLEEVNGPTPYEMEDAFIPENALDLRLLLEQS
jgi:hypothetical protein